MPHPASPLAALVARLTTACTPVAISAAQSALYKTVLPAHLRTCTALVQQAHGDVWFSAEDLAQDSIVDALPQLRRGACPNLQHDGLLRWLNVVAQRRLGAMIGKHSTAIWHDLSDDLVADPAHDAADDASTDDDTRMERETLRHRYQRALAEMPQAQATTWIVVVEQETPAMMAAAALGVHRETVRRRVAAARAHLATRLQAYAR